MKKAFKEVLKEMFSVPVLIMTAVISAGMIVGTLLGR